MSMNRVLGTVTVVDIGLYIHDGQEVITLGVPGATLGAKFGPIEARAIAALLVTAAEAVERARNQRKEK